MLYVLLFATFCPFYFCNHLDEVKELVALLSLSSWYLVIVVWFFLAVPWVCLQFVIVVFPDHTHLLFLGNPNIAPRYASEWTECTSAGKSSKGDRGLMPYEGVQIAWEFNGTR